MTFSKYISPYLNYLKIKFVENNLIMETASLRQKLHQYIDKSDDTLLKLMYALAKEYNEEDDFQYEFTEDDIKEFNKRTESRLSGESKTYSWQEAKDIIEGKSSME